MPNPLYDIPGLGGYLASQDRRRAMGQQDMQGNLQQIKLADLLNAREQEMQDKQQLQSVMSQTGGDPSKAIQALLTQGTPKSIELASKLKGLLPQQEKSNYSMKAKELIDSGYQYGTPEFNAAMKASMEKGESGAAPYFAPVQSGGGVYILNARTGKMELAKDPTTGKPIIGSGSDPTLQGAIAGAKETGQAKAKRALNMAGLTEAIDEAKSLLSGTSGKALPTGSGIGTVYDYAAGFIGKSPAGAAEAQTLKAIGGALTSKMPRMEGPQSDRDTQLYREMAAVVGDSTVPRERRLAALQKVEDLWGKYADNVLTNQQPSQPPAGIAPKRIKFDSQGNMVQ